MMINSVTAMLIVACPCALLLSSTFTNGNLLRIFSNNGLFIRDTLVIEQSGKIGHIVFDKTGTITQSSNNTITVSGHELNDADKDLLFSIVCHSHHPHSKALASWLGSRAEVWVAGWKEIPGKGLQATNGKDIILVGSGVFTGISTEELTTNKATVYVRINDNVTKFHFAPAFRTGIPGIVAKLKNRYKLSLLSGDNNRQKREIEKLFADAILDANKFRLLPAILKLAKASRYIIISSFAVSIIYNVAGLYFAMQGMLKPMVAAILMPCSTLSIILITSGVSSLVAKGLGLSLKSDE